MGFPILLAIVSFLYMLKSGQCNTVESVEHLNFYLKRNGQMANFQLMTTTSVYLQTKKFQLPVPSHAKLQL